MLYKCFVLAGCRPIIYGIRLKSHVILDIFRAKRDYNRFNPFYYQIKSLLLENN